MDTVIRLSDIARHAKVSVAAVSLALRSRPGVSDASRARVKQIAEQLGYRPNPLVSAYQTSVRRNLAPGYHGTLAWIDDAPDHMDRLRDDVGYRAMFSGAAEQALARGFKLEMLRLRGIDPKQDGQNKNRFETILQARGIPGAIFPPLWNSELLSHDWSDLAVVAHGANAGFIEKHAKPGWEQLCYSHLITDSYHDTRLVMRHLRALGYSRIGLVTSRHHETGAEYRFSAGYHSFAREKQEASFAPFVTDADLSASKPPRGFLPWLRQHRPDALVTTLNYVRPWLVACGKRVPEDIGIAHPFLRDTETGWSGVRENSRLVGSMMADAVVDQIYRNEKGLPSTPRVMLLAGRWESGSTTRAPLAEPALA